MRMPIKDGRPRVNVKPYRPNICTVQLKGQTFGWPSTRAAPCKRSLIIMIIIKSKLCWIAAQRLSLKPGTEERNGMERRNRTDEGNRTTGWNDGTEPQNGTAEQNDGTE